MMFRLTFSTLKPGTRGFAIFGQSLFETVGDVARFVNDTAKNIIVMAGAGLSTASGIPDFRSPGSGLYDNLEAYSLPYPEAIFELHHFLTNPKPFLNLARSLYPSTSVQPNAGHYFVRLLQDKGKLLRIYTQNIDGLEKIAGIKDEKLVEAHGSLRTASCIMCQKKQDPQKIKQEIMEGAIPLCFACNGLVKPDIVFFGEMMPERFNLYHEDVMRTDLLFVIGTSLEVYPFASIANEVRTGLPRVLINRTAVGNVGLKETDFLVKGDIVENVHEIAASLGWEKDLQKLLTAK